MGESSSSGPSKPKSEERVDLTDLIALSKKLEESGQMPEAPSSEGALVFEQPPQEKVTAFESLESLPPVDHPAESISLDPPADDLESPTRDSPRDSKTPDLNSNLDLGGLDFQDLAEPEAAPSLDAPTESASDPNPSLRLEADHNAPPEVHPDPLEVPSGDFNLSGTSNSPKEATLEPLLDPSLDLGAADPVRPNETLPPEPLSVFTPPSPADPAPLPQSLQHKRFAASPSPIPAAFPFTLKVTGHLPSHHRSRLESLIGREALGISVEDLKPQFEAGRLLLPRISEYAVILVLQSLRDAPVEFEAHPCDLEDLIPEEAGRIPSFALGESIGEENADASGTRQPSGDRAQFIESIAVIPAGPQSAAALEERQRLYRSIDTLTASMIVSAAIVRSPRSEDYIEAIERLKTELRHKAFWKGADALLDFSIQLQPVSAIGSEGVAYRVTASGCAARKI